MSKRDLCEPCGKITLISRKTNYEFLYPAGDFRSDFNVVRTFLPAHVVYVLYKPVSHPPPVERMPGYISLATATPVALKKKWLCLFDANRRRSL